MNEQNMGLDRSFVERVVGSENLEHWDKAKNGQLSVSEMIGEISKTESLGQVIIDTYDVSEEDISKWESGEYTCNDLCGLYIVPEKHRDEFLKLSAKHKQGQISEDEFSSLSSKLLSE